MIPAEALVAATKALYWNPASNGAGNDAPETWTVCESAAREVLEAAAPYILSHFANRISWRCSECEDQIDPEAALRKLQEEAGH